MNKLATYWMLACLVLATSAFGQNNAVAEPPQIAKLHTEYLRTRQRDTSATVTKYLRDLEALKQRLGRAAKLEYGVAVEREIRRVTEEAKPKTREGAVAPRGKRVTISCYMEENFKGREYRVEGPAEYENAVAAGIPNDRLASLKIPPGTAVTIFGGPKYNGPNQRLTGDVPSVGELVGKTTSLKIEADTSSPATGGESSGNPELTALQAAYEAEVKRVAIPSVTAYRRSLQALKEQFTRESKFEAALAVDRELQKMTDEGQ